jgi:uncharacterized repeat protein (TIGR04052 family)
MKKSYTFTLAACSLISTAALVACGGGSSSGPQSVTIDFAAVAGTTPVTCASTVTGLGTTSASGTLSDLRFYISNVNLVKADGSTAALTLSATDDYNATKGSDTVTLIDLEDKTGSCAGTTAMNTSIKGTVPAGDYVGVKMTLGVPFAMNHTDQSADVSVTPAVINNAVHPGMAWTWAGGRKFTKIEVTNSTWTAPFFYVHLGSTGCTGTNPAAGLVDTCSRPDRVDFSLASFNPSTQKVAVDVKALLSANDVTVSLSGPTPGCMSASADLDCPAIFNALSLDLTSGQTLNSGLNQRLFKVVSK